jgi:hypothetical protein
MPTFERLPRFDKDWQDLNAADQQRFREAVTRFVDDLRSGRFRKGLSVKRIQGTSSIYEMTFSPDGRATWQYGDEIVQGEPHVIWRRIGTHDVFDRP